MQLRSVVAILAALVVHASANASTSTSASTDEVMDMSSWKAAAAPPSMIPYLRSWSCQVRLGKDGNAVPHMVMVADPSTHTYYTTNFKVGTECTPEDIALGHEITAVESNLKFDSAQLQFTKPKTVLNRSFVKVVQHIEQEFVNNNDSPQTASAKFGKQESSTASITVTKTAGMKTTAKVSLSFKAKGIGGGGELSQEFSFGVSEAKTTEEKITYNTEQTATFTTPPRSCTVATFKVQEVQETQDWHGNAVANGAWIPNTLPSLDGYFGPRVGTLSPKNPIVGNGWHVTNDDALNAIGEISGRVTGAVRYRVTINNQQYPLSEDGKTCDRSSSGSNLRGTPAEVPSKVIVDTGFLSIGN